eukprot:TRINITY_DN5536_c1_g2_i3.p1 TRINITY_DN5536_c1_g2~~TRINITY_DN5536_c1_g2_i3.p1  ORF type:complete len:377 (-),score=73.29 TRINITY_DN5536_c1_g2_i3:349-1479(-)
MLRKKQRLLDPKELPSGINSTNAENMRKEKEKEKSKQKKQNKQEQSQASSTSTSRGDSSSSFCSSSPGTTASVQSSVTSSSTSSTDSKNDSVSSNSNSGKSEAESSDSSLKLSRKDLQNVVQRLEKLKRKRDNQDEEVLQTNTGKKSKIQREDFKEKSSLFQNESKNQPENDTLRDFQSVRDESLNDKEVIQRDLQSVHKEVKQRDLQSVRKENKQEDFQSVQKFRQFLQTDVQSVQKEQHLKSVQQQKFEHRDYESVQELGGVKRKKGDEEMDSPIHKKSKVSRMEFQQKGVEQLQSRGGEVEREFLGAQMSFNNDISQIGVLQRVSVPQNQDRWQLQAAESLQDENQIGDVEKNESQASGPPIMKSIAVSSAHL